ncbi:unnamed protein product [Vicia faba]|uniref:AT-hook motif nuclear-localized protein n=1 Tax=Vicia faba TaxID=3906 RepID=A0AAV0YVN0_VICFA|nr:unnamed protein product [Vicia faba]
MEQMSRVVNELDSIHFSIKKASELVKEIDRQWVATDKCIMALLFLFVIGVIAFIIVKSRFEILSLAGSFMLTDNEGTRRRAGGMTISLETPGGRVVGGGVVGVLTVVTLMQGQKMGIPQTLLWVNRLSSRMVVKKRTHQKGNSEIQNPGNAGKVPLQSTTTDQPLLNVTIAYASLLLQTL